MLDRGYTNFQKSIYLATLLLALNISYLSAYYLFFKSFEGLLESKHLYYLFFSNLFCIMLSRVYGLYKVIMANPISLFIQAGAFQFLLSFLFVAVTKETKLYSMVAYMYGIYLPLSFILYTIVDLSIKRYEKSDMNYRKFVMVGLNSTSAEFVKLMREGPEARMQFMGFFDDIEGVEQKTLIKGDLSQIKDFLLSNKVDDVFCSLQKLNSEKIIDLINFCDNNLIRIHFLPEFFNLMSKRSVRFMMEYANNVPVLSIRREPLENLTNQIIKRTFDIIFSSIVIVFVLSWMVPLVGLIIKLESRGPIFFVQNRSGKNNEVFKMIKFRSMRPNKEADTKQMTKGDMRVTKVGKFIRKTSIDELPNFFNVFIGKMTVVGPRPHMLMHTEEYSKIIDKFMVRQFGKPGITGLAQVSGYRGETTDPVKMLKRIEKDVLYLENWSLGLDFQIILQTIWQVFTKPAE